MSAHILIKADDLVYGERNRMWQTFVDALAERSLPGSIGVIGFDTRNGHEKNPGRGDWLRERLDTVELWNHGYYHRHDEFRGQPLEVQAEQIRRTQAVIESLYGVHPRVFGAPFNRMDQTTLDACEAVGLAGVFGMGTAKEARVIELSDIFGVEAARPQTSRRVVNPVWRRLLCHHRRWRGSGLAVLELHPRRWDRHGARRFERMLDFLLRRGCEFVRLRDVVGPTVPGR